MPPPAVIIVKESFRGHELASNLQLKFETTTRFSYAKHLACNFLLSEAKQSISFTIHENFHSNDKTQSILETQQRAFQQSYAIFINLTEDRWAYLQRNTLATSVRMFRVQSHLEAMNFVIALTDTIWYFRRNLYSNEHF